MQNNTTKNTINEYIWIAPLLLILSLIFITIHSASTSPCYIGYGGDSANYLAMGNMLLNGLIPYIDFFDHKGPMMIFIEAFGQILVPDRTGIFIMQVANLTLISFLTYATARLFLEKAYALSVVFIMLFFFAFTIERGNLTEEYSLLFISLTTLLTAKHLRTKSTPIRPIHAFLIGICGAFLFWIRLNNMGVVCASSVFLFIVCIKEKAWKDLKNLIFFFFLGFVTISIPVLIYFQYNKALYDMIFAAFIYNFQYAGTNEEESHFRDFASTFFYILKAWTPFIVLTIGSLLYYIKGKNYKIILFAVTFFVFGFITSHVGAAYYHYMTLNIPCLVMGCIFILKALTSKEQASKSPIILCMIALLSLGAFSAHKYKSMGGGTAGDSHYIQQAKDLVEKIPVNERNSIFAYQTMTRFHASAGVMPYYKNFMMQEWQGKYNPQIITDINNMMIKNPPLWIFTQFRDQSTNAAFWQIVDLKYDLFQKNDIFELYRLKM